MGLKIYGHKKLQINLKDKAQMKLVKEIVKKHGASLQQEMVKNAVFKKGYSTGATRRSINILIEKGGLMVRVKPTTKYSPYVEYGTRFMDKQPFVKPAFQQVKKEFVNDLKKLT